jgi:hypothetical protein
VNPRRRRHRRAVRTIRRAVERSLSRDACLYGKVHTRAEAPYLGTFAVWRKLPVLPDRLGIIYHPSLIRQMNRRSVLLDLLRPSELAEGGRP